MWTIYADNARLFNPEFGYAGKIEAAVVKQELSSAGSLEFTLPYNNPAVADIKTMKSIIKVYRDDALFFAGRVNRVKRDFRNNYKYSCEGFLAFLHDTVVEPFSTLSGGVSGFLTKVLAAHNAQSDAAHQITLGTVTVQDYYSTTTAANADYISCWDIIKARLLDTDIGGYIVPRYGDDGKFYIDYIDVFQQASQTIEFAKNLLDLTVDTDDSDVFSAIMPVGDNGTTIAPLTDGDLTDDLYKIGYMVFSRQYKDRFGSITRLVRYNTTDRQTLLQNAMHDINTMLLPDKIKVGVIDLHTVDATVSPLNLGHAARVVSTAHDIEKWYPIAAVDTDLIDPSGSKITLGVT